MSNTPDPHETAPQDNQDPNAPPPKRPPGPGVKGVLGGIIRTSKATSTKLTQTGASMAARKCRSCGAGRPKGTDVRVCAYCGDRFMTDDVDTGVAEDSPGGEDSGTHESP